MENAAPIESTKPASRNNQQVCCSIAKVCDDHGIWFGGDGQHVWLTNHHFVERTNELVLTKVLHPPKVVTHPS